MLVCTCQWVGAGLGAPRSARKIPTPGWGTGHEGSTEPSRAGLGWTGLLGLLGSHGPSVTPATMAGSLFACVRLVWEALDPWMAPPRSSEVPSNSWSRQLCRSGGMFRTQKLGPSPEAGVQDGRRLSSAGRPPGCPSAAEAGMWRPHPLGLKHGGLRLDCCPGSGAHSGLTGTCGPSPTAVQARPHVPAAGVQSGCVLQNPSFGQGHKGLFPVCPLSGAAEGERGQARNSSDAALRGPLGPL